MEPVTNYYVNVYTWNHLIINTGASLCMMHFAVVAGWDEASLTTVC